MGKPGGSLRFSAALNQVTVADLCEFVDANAIASGQIGQTTEGFILNF